jgi:hypothetical protein
MSILLSTPGAAWRASARRRGRLVAELGLRSHDRERPRRHLHGLLGRAVQEQPQLRLPVHQVAEQALGAIRQVAEPVAVEVVAAVVAPEVAAVGDGELVPAEPAAAEDGHLLHVLDERVVAESIPLHGGHEGQADVVVGNDVPDEVVEDVDRPRRVVEVDAHAVAREDVSGGLDAVHVLEPDAVPAGTAVVRADVAAEDQVPAVHEERADRVVLQPVVLQNVVIAVHEVQAVPPVADPVAPDVHAGGEPHHDVAAVAHDVVLDDRARAVPQPDAVTAPRDVERLAADDVSADDALRRFLQVDAEQHVLEGVLQDPRPRREDGEPGVLTVQAVARVADREAAHRDVGRLDPHDVATAAAIDHDDPVGHDLQRPVDHKRTAVHAGGDSDHRPLRARHERLHRGARLRTGTGRGGRRAAGDRQGGAEHRSQDGQHQDTSSGSGAVGSPPSAVRRRASTSGL